MILHVLKAQYVPGRAAAPPLVWQPSVNQKKPRTLANLLIRSSPREIRQRAPYGWRGIDTLHLHTHLER
jgi:hypothetical protein